MSDSDKNGPDSPQDADSEQKPQGAVVISIEQARAELLGKPRQRPTPREGRRARARAGEVPAPVTLAPGEHAAVIVTDTPAARAHVDKKTVHPAEMPHAPQERKKVRLKTSLDPRRMKTQRTERRPEELPVPASAPPPPAATDADTGRRSRPPVAALLSTPPRSAFARPKPLPRTSHGAPMFAIGVVLAALIGAVLVYTLRQKAPQSIVPSMSTSTAPAPVKPAASETASSAPATSSEITVDTASSSSAEPTAQPSATVESAPSVTKSTTFVKPVATATAKPTATAAPTTTTTKNILPFGKEEP